jgi:hypothetical protein
MRHAGRWILPWAMPALIKLLLASPALAATGLHVIPFPGTPDASPVSHIIFSSLRPSDVRTVLVTGSHSGPHQGRLVSLPDDAGTAFIADQPFTNDEQVNVTAALNSAGAGTASGDPGSTALRFTFTIAVPVSSNTTGKPARALTADGWLTSPSSSSTPTQHFHSAPWLHPPIITATSDPDRTSGDIFLTPGHPMILDSQGRLVWFDQVGDIANLEVQRYHSRPVLTWSQRTPSSTGKTVPKEVIMNRSYRVVKDLYAGDGYQADLHDFQLTPQGTAFIDAYVPVRADLQRVGGPADGSAMDSVIQELDVRTGQLLWEWHVLGHVPLTASYAKPIRSLTDDYFHLNSIQPLPNGNILISARNTWAVYEIDRATGHVIWSLGGRSSSFKMGPGTNFEWQHDAHLAGNTLTLFDDAALPQEERQSSAKVLRLNTSAMTASLIARYRHTPPLLSPVTGSAQLLPDHNVFVGWGRQPHFSEYTQAGRQIFDASFPLGVASYRAFRFPWHARPASRPVLASSRRGNGTTVVWASWNGATEVASWRVLGGDRVGKLRALARASRSGFETRIVVHGQPRFVSVQALSARGKILRTSGAQSTSS